jgi:hypothetical protein
MMFLHQEKVFLQSWSGGVLHAFLIRARSDHSSSATVTSLMAFKLCCSLVRYNVNLLNGTGWRLVTIKAADHFSVNFSPSAGILHCT